VSDWSLPKLLASLHRDIEHKLKTVRESIAHPTSKGDGSENVWLELLQTYLPKRYQAERAFVIDSLDHCSDQVDVVVFDRQYTPFIFNYQGQIIVPAEAVYAVFESKQTIDAGIITYAQAKIASVRALLRTSIPIPHAGGVYTPKPLHSIIGGVLAFDSEWSPAFGEPLDQALRANDKDGRIDIGCIAGRGHFAHDLSSDKYQYHLEGKPATAFLFKLISMLQFCGTVPMIDLEAYGRWLDDAPVPAQ
jgi:hypothetical protein